MRLLPDELKGKRTCSLEQKWVQRGRLMGTGIMICGLNGSGKSTVGKALAEKLRFHFIDNEYLYFPKTDHRYIYACSRTREEAERRFLHEIKAHENFVFACVKGEFEEAISALFQYAVLIDVPQDIRMQRVVCRSFQKFGKRMLPGGDLYEQEKSFFEIVKARTQDTVEEWIQLLSCPVIRIDGTKPLESKLNLIIKQMHVPVSMDMAASPVRRYKKVPTEAIL